MKLSYILQFFSIGLLSRYKDTFEDYMSLHILLKLLFQNGDDKNMAAIRCFPDFSEVWDWRRVSFVPQRVN